MDKFTASQMNCLNLAFLGDSIYSFRIREHMVTTRDIKLKEINKICNSLVCANNQALIMDKLAPTLTEDEADIARRARNIHTSNIAKHSTHEQYSKATQLEALLGYWHLSGQADKIQHTIDITLEEL